MTAAVTSFCGVALVVTTLLTCSCTAPRAPHGPLIIVGGGGTPRAAIEHGVGLANGRPVVILPQASRREDAGHSSARMFIDAGASSASRLFACAPPVCPSLS